MPQLASRESMLDEAYATKPPSIKQKGGTKDKLYDFCETFSFLSALLSLLLLVRSSFSSSLFFPLLHR